MNAFVTTHILYMRARMSIQTNESLYLFLCFVSLLPIQSDFLFIAVRLFRFHSKFTLFFIRNLQCEWKWNEIEIVTACILIIIQGFWMDVFFPGLIDTHVALNLAFISEYSNESLTVVIITIFCFLLLLFIPWFAFENQTQFNFKNEISMIFLESTYLSV